VTWDQFISGLLSLALVAAARWVDRWLPASTTAPEPPTAPPAPDTQPNGPQAP